MPEPTREDLIRFVRELEADWALATRHGAEANNDNRVKTMFAALAADLEAHGRLVARLGQYVPVETLNRILSEEGRT